MIPAAFAYKRATSVDEASRWLAQGGKVIDSVTQPIRSADTGYKEFHRPAPAKGWAPGTYLVTLYLNGDSAQAKTFAVRK